MLVASGPYNNPIPFVNIQEIRLNTNIEGALIVTLGISNETSTTTGAVTLGNYVMVSANKSKIVNLSRNIPQLIESIKQDAEGRTELHLVKSDFVLKVGTSNPGEASQQVYSYVHEVTKVINRSDDLYALVVSYTNFEDQYTIGNIITDKLLSKKKVPTQAKLYVLDETTTGYGTQGSIWPGAAHIHDKKIMAGASHTEFEHPFITARPALNIKSKDMRVIQLAQSLRFDERPADAGSSRSYFSPLTLSRSSRGTITGLFSFDHLRFAIENARFGRLIKNDSTLLSASRLKDIIIYQKILTVDSAGNELTPGRSSHGAINDQKMSTRVASLNAGLKITSTSNNDTILNVSFEDIESDDLVGNLVEYSVEVLLDDNTGTALQSIVDQLAAALPRYQKGSSPPYKEIIDLYLASVQAVFGPTPFRTLTASMWQKSLIALTALTGLHATEDQGSVLETIQEFTNKLNRAISTTQNNASATPNYHSKIYSATRDAGSRTTYVFYDKYRIRDSAGYGLDYLESHLIRDKNILPVLSYEAMNTRSKDELKKYNINNPTANSINTVGYLSPESAKLGPKLNPVPTTTLQNSNDNFVSIIRSAKELNLVTSPEPAKDLATDKKETLALAGVSIAANEISLRKQVFDVAIVKPTTMDSKGYLSNNSGFTRVNTPEEIRVSGSTESVAKSKKLTARPTTTPVVADLIDKTITSFQTITKLTNTNSIKGSIALAKAEQDAALIEESDAMTNLLNFGSLVQVQYLAAYDRNLGVKKQNWKLLTDKIAGDAAASNQTLICRLVAVSNTIDAPSIVQLSTLSSLFTLGPGFIKPMFPSFVARFNTILAGFTDAPNINLKDIDSVDTLYANNMPLSSKVTVTADPNQDNNTSPRPGRRRPRPAGGLRY